MAVRAKDRPCETLQTGCVSMFMATIRVMTVVMTLMVMVRLVLVVVVVATASGVV